MSDILKIAQDMGDDLFEVGVMDQITKRQLDTLCLPKARVFEPVEIRRIRSRNRVSQSVFASVLGVGKTTVQHWEQGVKKPSGPARKLIDLVDRKGLSVFG
jgi:putative transcriptional regulator